MSHEGAAAPRRLFYRELPSGGHVSIQIRQIAADLGDAQLRGEIVVERRASPRRTGVGAPPVVAVVERASLVALVRTLLPTALDDRELAGRLDALRGGGTAAAAVPSLPFAQRGELLTG